MPLLVRSVMQQSFEEYIKIYLAAYPSKCFYIIRQHPPNKNTSCAKLALQLLWTTRILLQFSTTAKTGLAFSLSCHYIQQGLYVPGWQSLTVHYQHPKLFLTFISL